MPGTELRRCLRPAHCPFGPGALPASAETWLRLLSSLLPGDAPLALELVADLRQASLL